ncbi:hypothetical protein [Kitasatospora sp. NPDC058190]|uniref:hypothetical protein n=1 Tax=Kitasatospora sp. NPDC058190 TaxID=3346371 RepID=UPI0036DA832A
MRSIVKTAAVALGGIALAVSGQGIAGAATTATTSTTPVPSCVTAQASYFFNTLVAVTNGCSTQQSVRVNFGPSTNQCVVLQAGQTTTVTEPDFFWFTGLTTC